MNGGGEQARLADGSTVESECASGDSLLSPAAWEIKRTEQLSRQRYAEKFSAALYELSHPGRDERERHELGEALLLAMKLKEPKGGWPGWAWNNCDLMKELGWSREEVTAYLTGEHPATRVDDAAEANEHP